MTSCLKNKAPRIFGYDLLKALSMLGIVFYHLHSIRFGEVPVDGSIYYPGIGKIFYGLLSAGIPIFFMVNGAIVGNRDVTLKKSLKSSLRIALIAIIGTLFFKWLVYPYLFHEPRITNPWALWEYYWFFYTYAAVQILTCVLNRVAILRKIIVGALIIFPFLSNLVWDIILVVSPSTALPSWGHTGFLTLYAIVYYYLGRSLAHFQISNLVSVLFIIVGLLFLNFEVFSMTNAQGIVFDSVSSCFPTLGSLSISAGFFLLLKDWNPKSSHFSRFFSFIGQRTLGVYLFQATLNKLIILYVFRQQYQSPMLVALFAVFVTFVSAMIWDSLMQSNRFIYNYASRYYPPTRPS